MSGTIVVGTGWGDEGKGKVTDVLAGQAEHVARGQGGNNAGHTLQIEGRTLKLHLIPSGILHTGVQCYIGAGTVIDPAALLEEMSQIDCAGRLTISPAAHVIFPYHRQIDQEIERVRRVGTTGRGIGPCYADRAHRIGIPLGMLNRREALQSALELRGRLLVQDLGEHLEPFLEMGSQLEPFLGPVEERLAEAMERGEAVLLEGAQGALLDIHLGTYPFVTSSSTLAAGVCAGVGLGVTGFERVVGITKAFMTRVGEGPFPSEIEEGILEPEYGTTTGRQRRAGWLDFGLLRRAARLHGLTCIALTKLDGLDHLEEVELVDGDTRERMPGWRQVTSGARSFEALPEGARRYVERIEEAVDLPVDLISVGPGREETILRGSLC